MMHIHRACEKWSPSVISKHIKNESALKRSKNYLSLHNNNNILTKNASNAYLSRKRSSSYHWSFKGFLAVVFLWGDIYKNEQTHKPYTKMVTNLIRYKLVQKQAKQKKML